MAGPSGQSALITRPSAGRIIRRTVGDGVAYLTVRTLPSPKTNCGPPALGEPQLSPPHDSPYSVQPGPDASSGKSISRESGYSPSPQRPVPPVPPMIYGSSQYHTPARYAR